MMSSENIPPPPQPPNHHHNTNRKQPEKTTQEQSQPQPPPLKCPRCDSPNTKFCYYNNYSLTQPRHFCKTCRRYWTKGGALRNVPIGGGCRKTKKHKPSQSSQCQITSSSSSSPPEFRFLAPPPSIDFHLGGLSLPRLHPATAGVYTHFIATSASHHLQPPPPPPQIGGGSGGLFSLDLLGLGNYPPIPNSGNPTSSNSSSLSLAGNSGVGVGGDHTLTISSIESLSTINQEMHWKLQQQRLALIYGPSSIEQDDHNNNNNNNNHQQDKTLESGGIHLFKPLENSRNKLDVIPTGTPTEWLFDQIPSNSTSSAHYGVSDNNNNNASVIASTTTTCNNTNNSGNYDEVWTTDLHHHHHQFNGLQ